MAETLEKAPVHGVRRARSSARAAAAPTPGSTPSTMWPISAPTPRIPVDRLPLAVNTHLPEDIVVQAAYEVAEDFNAIGSCIKKEYTYRIYNSRIKQPVLCEPGVFLPQAPGRGGHGPGGPDV